jgi:membrane-bound ClpP family serine protease
VAHAPRITGMRSAFFTLAIVTALLSSSVSDAQEQSGVYLLDLRGPIGPATSDYVHRGLEKVPRDKGALIILQIDTPGGLDTSMRSIIQDILQSPIPVVSFVAPSGARAASAGTYIMYASHVSVMAPGTNLGAATPVQIGVPQPPPLEKENTKQPPGKKEKSHPTMRGAFELYALERCSQGINDHETCDTPKHQPYGGWMSDSRVQWESPLSGRRISIGAIPWRLHIR